MSDTRPTIVSVNISPGGIPKHPIDAGPVTTDGIAGDGHDHEKHNTRRTSMICGPRGSTSARGTWVRT
jgi:hypothetical protein